MRIPNPVDVLSGKVAHIIAPQLMSDHAVMDGHRIAYVLRGKKKRWSVGGHCAIPGSTQAVVITRIEHRKEISERVVREAGFASIAHFYECHPLTWLAMEGIFIIHFRIEAG